MSISPWNTFSTVDIKDDEKQNFHGEINISNKNINLLGELWYLISIHVCSRVRLHIVTKDFIACYLRHFLSHTISVINASDMIPFNFKFITLE